VDDPETVRLRQPSHTCLPIDTICPGLSCPSSGACLQVLALDIFHGDEVAPSASPISNILQTFRWPILLDSRSSLLKRSMVSLSEAISGLISLRATFL